MSKKSPMLAERESIHLYPEKISFPLYATPKLDGIRCIVSEARAVSRSFTDIANNYIRKLLSAPEFTGFDGELTVGPLSAENVYNVTQGAVNGNRVKEPIFTWHLFDDFTDPLLPYNERRVKLTERLVELCERTIETDYKLPPLNIIEATRIETWEGLEAYEDMVLGKGFEGVITRSPGGLYKFGRSSKTTQGMMKLKRFTDGEAEIIGFVELMRNTNADLRDNLGRAKRSKAKDGLVPGGTLGVMLARDLVTKVEFEIGMFKGLTNEDKQEIWDNQKTYLGKIAKYQHFSHGAIDKPRHSKFLGWRDKSDM